MNEKQKNVERLSNEKIPQLPELNFYQSVDSCIYFDATHYLEAKGLCEKHNVEEFRREFSLWIDSMQKAYGISLNDVFVLDARNGHQLIDEALAILFVAYTDENYRVLLIERMSEMEITGVTFSDSRLIEAVRNRFSKELVTKIMEAYDKE